MKRLYHILRTILYCIFPLILTLNILAYIACENPENTTEVPVLPGPPNIEDLQKEVSQDVDILPDPPKPPTMYKTVGDESGTDSYQVVKDGKEIKKISVTYDALSGAPDTIVVKTIPIEDTGMLSKFQQEEYVLQNILQSLQSPKTTANPSDIVVVNAGWLEDNINILRILWGTDRFDIAQSDLKQLYIVLDLYNSKGILETQYFEITVAEVNAAIRKYQGIIEELNFMYKEAK